MKTTAKKVDIDECCRILNVFKADSVIRDMMNLLMEEVMQLREDRTDE